MGSARDVLEGDLVGRDQARPRPALDAHVADRHPLLHAQGADRAAPVLEDVPGRPRHADPREEGQDDVLGGHARRERTFHADLERLRATLEQALGGEDVLDLAGADPERERPEGPVGGRVAVPAHDGHPRLGQAQLRTDDVDDPLVRRTDAVEGNAELGAVLLEAAHLGGGHQVEDRQAPIRGGDRVVDRGQGLVRTPHPQAAGPQPVEGLRARHLVDEVQVHVQHVGDLVRAAHDDVLVPDLVHDGAGSAPGSLIGHWSGHPSRRVKPAGRASTLRSHGVRPARPQPPPPGRSRPGGGARHAQGHRVHR